MSESAAVRGMLESESLTGGAFERALFALLYQLDDFAVVESVEGGVAIVRFPMSGRSAFLIADRDDARARDLKPILKAASQQGLEIAIISDEAAADKRLTAMVPLFTPAPVPQLRFDSAGKVHGVANVPETKGPLHKTLLAAGALDTLDWAEIDARRGAGLAEANEKLAEARELTRRLAGRRARATFVLLAVIGVTFALQMAVSTESWPWALRRLGALDAALLRGGEWWRLVSCTFLHGSFVHVLFNSFVLLALGMQLEKILGTSRFVILYAVSGIVGSVVSAVRLDEGDVSVGASGALWGLLAAEVLLVVHPKSPLPSTVKQGAKQGVMLNLVLNVVNSFRPHVDFAAHLGGGLAGAAVTLLMMRAIRTDTKDGPVLKAGAGVASLLYATGFGLALAASQFWVVLEPPSYARVEIAELAPGVTASIPAIIAQKKRPQSAEGADTVVGFSDLSVDPLYAVIVRIALEVESKPDELLEQAEGLKAGFGKSEDKDETLVSGPSLSSWNDSVLLAKRVKLANGLFMDSVLRLTPAVLYRVDVVIFPDVESSWPAAAVRIAESIEEPRPPRPPE